MLGRYLGIALMTLLVGLWLASGVYGLLLLGRTENAAASVQLATQTVRDRLEAPEADDAGLPVFPQGQIAAAIKSGWATALPVRPFPRGLSTQSTAPAEHTRSPR